jgi:parallel beta-helix repeat protein
MINEPTVIADGVTVSIPATLTLWRTDTGLISGTAGGGTETLAFAAESTVISEGKFFDPATLTVTGLKNSKPEYFGASPSATGAVNSVAINAALSMGGNVEMLYPGTYLINATLLPASSSKFTIGRGVVIKLIDSADSNTDLIYVNTKTDVTITGGGKLDGNRANQSNLGMIGIEVSESPGLIVNDLEIVDTVDKLIHVKSNSTDVLISKIVGGTIQQGESGIRLDAGCDQGTIELCTIDDCGTDGSSQFGDGIYIAASYCKANNNTISGSNRIGIVLEGSGTHNKVFDNTLIDNGVDATNPPAGIWAEQGGNNTITNNTIDQTNVAVVNYGISIVEEDTDISGNHITGSNTTTSMGIRLIGDNLSATTNHVIGPVGGIVAGGSGTQTGVIMHDNIITDVQVGLRAFTAQKGISIKGNQVLNFQSTNATGLELNTGAVTFTDSIISGNIITGPVTVGGFTRDGMQLNNLSRCILDSNIVLNSEDTGIIISGTNVDNVISDNIVSGATTNWNVAGTYLASNNIGGLPHGVMKTFTDTDATPSVLDYNFFQTNGTTTITDFDDGVVGQVITIRATNNITITHNSAIIDLNGSANFNMASSEMLQLTMVSDGVWSETGRSIN